MTRTARPELWIPCWMVPACQYSAAAHVVRIQVAAKASVGTVNSSHCWILCGHVTSWQGC